MTLKDIAKETGVSISTVSRVINGNFTGAASKEVQDKIWAAARKGGYIPNTSAQTLRQGKQQKALHQSIACIYARSTDVQNDAFFSSLTRSIEQETLKNGYVVKYAFYTFDMDNPATQNQILDNTVDGAVILGRCGGRTLKYLKDHFHKIIYTGLNTIETDYDQVICDGYAIARDAVTYLLKQGHRRIGYIGDVRKEVRYNAYCHVLKEYQLPFDRNITAHVTLSSEGGYQGANRILNRCSDIDAIFCTNDITAIGAIKAIQEHGYQIPGQIAVISMDDIEIAQFVSPMLTTMHIPIDEMGKMAAKILIDRIEGGHTLPLKLSLPYYLVKRESA